MRRRHENLRAQPAGLRALLQQNLGGVSACTGNVSFVTHGIVVVEMSIASVADDASHHENKIRLSCASIYLEDPKQPSAKIEA